MSWSVDARLRRMERSTKVADGRVFRIVVEEQNAEAAIAHFRSTNGLPERDFLIARVIITPTQLTDACA